MSRDKKYKNGFPGQRAQVMMEFIFCMVILFLMIFAVIRALRWAGVDMVERRRAHDALLTSDIDESWSDCNVCNFSNPPGCTGCDGGLLPCVCEELGTFAEGPLKQIDPYFYKPIKMNLIWNGT